MSISIISRVVSAIKSAPLHAEHPPASLAFGPTTVGFAEPEQIQESPPTIRFSSVNAFGEKVYVDVVAVGDLLGSLSELDN